MAKSKQRARKARVEEEVVVGLWDCPRCGTVGISGLEEECPGCGAPRAKDTVFYLPQEGHEERVTDAATLHEAKAGPDWICEHCGGSVSAMETVCPHCGAPRGSSATLATHEYAPGEEPRSAAEARQGRRQPAPPPKRSRRGTVAVVLALIVAAFLTLVFYKRTVPVTVTALTWERTVAVEEYRCFEEGDWNLPKGARLLDQDRRVRSHRQVLDHYETATRNETKRVQVGTHSERVKTGTRSNGNGTFTEVYETRTEPVYESRTERVTYQKPIYRSEPVMDTWYSYEIWRWTHDRNEVTKGAMPTEPYWAQVRLAKDQREEKRTAEYQATFREKKGKQHSTSLPEPRWRTLHLGEAHTLRLNAFGRVLEVR